MNKEDLKKKEIIVFDYIKEQIKDKGYPPSVREICKDLGFKSTCTAHHYITKLIDKGYLEKSDSKMRALKVIDDCDFKEEAINLPVVGKVAAGEPIFAEQNIEDYISLNEGFFSSDTLKNQNFVLKVQGDSMINVHINNGDYLIVSKTNVARNGEIVVAMIEGEATVKTFYKEKDHIRLQPENDDMEPMIYDNVEIVGKVVGLLRRI